MPQYEMALMSVAAYRQVLRNMRNTSGAAPTEESAAALLQAKQRVMLRLQDIRVKRVQRDPRRAFSKLRGNLGALWDARDAVRLRVLARLSPDRHAAALRSAYDNLRECSLRAVSAATSPSTAAKSGDRPAGQCTRDKSAAAVSASTSAAEAVDISPQQLQRDVATVTGHHGFTRTLVLGAVASASKFFMQGMSSFRVDNREALEAALHRSPGRPLITVSNHVAAMDDPLLLAALTPLGSVLQPGAMRWGLCATDRCFKSKWMGAFFRAGQVLPVERGRGMQQPGMQAAQARLAAGEWVHIFPEGTRSPDGTTMGPVRAGVGRLVAGCAGDDPVVLPIVHDGMQHVMPRGTSVPVPGQEVRVLVGEPVQVADVMEAAREGAWSEQRLDRALADRIAQSLVSLKARLDGREEVGAPAAEAMSRLVEDELGAAGRPWGLSLRQRAGIPSSIPGALTSISTAGLSIVSPMDIAAAAMAPAGSKPRQSVHKEQHLWPLLQGLQSVLAAAGIPGAGYNQLRTTTMAAMLRPACKDRCGVKPASL